MGIRFIYHIKGNDRGLNRAFIKNEVDRSTDLYIAAVSTNPADYVYVRCGWHKTDEDKKDHITADVWIGGEKIGAAHINRRGQVTMY